MTFQLLENGIELHIFKSNGRLSALFTRFGHAYKFYSGISERKLSDLIEIHEKL